MQLTQLKRTANQREAGQSSWVELRQRRYRHFADATKLNSTRRRVELCRYKRALTRLRHASAVHKQRIFFRFIEFLHENQQ